MALLRQALSNVGNRVVTHCASGDTVAARVKLMEPSRETLTGGMKVGPKESWCAQNLVHTPAVVMISKVRESSVKIGVHSKVLGLTSGLALSIGAILTVPKIGQMTLEITIVDTAGVIPLL